MVTPLSDSGKSVSVVVDDAAGVSVTMMSGLSSSSSSSSSSKSTRVLLLWLFNDPILARGRGKDSDTAADVRGKGSDTAADVVVVVDVAGTLRDTVVFVPSVSVTPPASEASTMVTVEVVVVVGAVLLAEEEDVELAVLALM